MTQCVRGRWQTGGRAAVRLEKYRRRRNAAKNQSARRRRRLDLGANKKILNETRANSDSSEFHPLIASIRQQTLSTFEMDAERSRKQKPPSPNVVRGKRKMCSKIPKTHTQLHTYVWAQVSSAHLSHIHTHSQAHRHMCQVDDGQNLLLATCARCWQKCCRATF